MTGNIHNQIKILITDDDKSVLFILEKILRTVGCQVSTFETGEATLENLYHNTYDTAIIDVKLQDMNGIDLLKSIQRIAPNMTKILLTGYPSEEDKLRAIELGADYYLEKPIPSEKLIKLVTDTKKY